MKIWWGWRLAFDCTLIWAFTHYFSLCKSYHNHAYFCSSYTPRIELTLPTCHVQTQRLSTVTPRQSQLGGLSVVASSSITHTSATPVFGRTLMTTNSTSSAHSDRIRKKQKKPSLQLLEHHQSKTMLADYFH